METQATQPPSGSSTATAYPRWVLFERYGKVEAGSNSTADAWTLATARTSTGHHIGVSLRLAAPPAVSSICIHFPHGVMNARSTVVAAHGDSVLTNIWFEEGYHDKTDDYFVYNAGAAAAEPPRLPSLSLLPPYYFTQQELDKYPSWRSRGPVQRGLGREGTGHLRCGEDELAVAELKIAAVSDDTLAQEAELFLFRSGQWSVKRPVAIHCDSQDDGELLSSWRTHTVLPVGDAQLCWVDLSLGLLFCNVFDESPVLQHVPLPVEAEELEPDSGSGSSRGVCVTAGSTVRFVGVFPRCCCGGTGSTHCQRSRHAYTINTWTLRMDGMVWVMDGMVDATELWALNAYEGIPRVPPVCPIVSLDDPHTICFIVCEWCHDIKGDKAGWLILVDTRRKALLSVCRHSDAGWLSDYNSLLSSRVSYYLISNPSSGNSASSSREGHIDTIPSPVAVIDELQTNDASDSVLSSCKSSAEPAMEVSAFLAAFQEIPSYGLDRDGMLKAYSILSQDNCRRFRSLLGLPKNLRKDWLLMEIKATEA